MNNFTMKWFGYTMTVEEISREGLPFGATKVEHVIGRVEGKVRKLRVCYLSKGFLTGTMTSKTGTQYVLTLSKGDSLTMFNQEAPMWVMKFWSYLSGNTSGVIK